MSAPYDPLEPAYKRQNQNVIYDKNISMIDKELKEYMEKEIILETNEVTC